MRRVLSLCLLAGLGAARASALDPGRGLTQYVHDVWGVQHGLPHTAARALAQDREGYLWVGTPHGLVRFDGEAFRVVDLGRRPRRAQIFALHAGGEGLWVGTSSPAEVYRILDANVVGHHALPGAESADVQALAEAPEGTLWIGTSRGLWRLQGGVLTDETARLPSGSTDVQALRASRARGGLWIGTARGLIHLDGARAVRYTRRDGMGGNDVRALFEGDDGVLWMGGMTAGLTRLEGGAFTTVPITAGTVPASVQTIVADGEGNLWVGTRRGLVRYRPASAEMTSHPAPPGLLRDHVMALVFDREGSLWIATEEQSALHRLRDSPVVRYGAGEGLPSERIRAVRFDAAGRAWLGTDDGLFRWHEREGVSARLVVRDCASETRVTSVLEDSRGTLWFSGSGRVFRLPHGAARAEPVAIPGLSCYLSGTMIEGPPGTIWIANRGSGLFALENGRVTRYTTADGLPSQKIYTLHRARDGTLWAGANVGMAARRDGKWTVVEPEGQPLQDNVYAFHEDEDSLWVGTDQHGLLRLRAGAWTRYTQAHGLPSNSVYAFEEDLEGRLWVMCEKGLYGVDKRELSTSAPGRRLSSVRLFTETDGLSLVSEGLRHPGSGRTPDGRLWFATQGGLAMMDPRRLRKKAAPPAVRVERVVRNGQAADSHLPGDFPAGTASYEFIYTSLLTPGPIRYRYRLAGYEEGWNEAGSRRVAYYTGLPPGRYTFEVVAGNDDQWSPAGARYEFRQRPFVYQTWWFYLSSALALVLAGASVTFARQRRALAEQRRLGHLVEERTQELTEATRQLDVANRGLAEANAGLERRVAEGIAALREAERMAAYGQMVAAVAHEVRHPIFALQASAYVLGDRLRGDAAVESHVRTLESQTRRLDALMKDLLEFAKPHALAPAAVPVGELVAEVVEAFRAQCSPCPPVAVEVEAGLPSVFVDRFRLGQALLNLLHNAAAHARGLERVTIRACRRAEGGAELVRLSVVDDGAGIPEAVQGRLFDPFVTTGAGAGLGLAIVRRTVRAHGGDVHVESAPGAGAAFHVDIPVGRPG